MSLGAFMTDEKLGSWADEMEDMPVSDSRSGYGTEKRTYGSTNATYGSGNLAGYSVREELPLPDKPPYTVHLGNLSFDATIGDVTDFFSGCECTNVRIIEDKLEMKPKGFGYAEFGSRDGLIKALALSGSQFQGRNIRVSVADPPKDRDRPDVRELGDWSRKGPLPDLPGRGGNDRRVPDRGFGSGRTFGDVGPEAGGDRRDRRDAFPQDDGKIRDFGNWERRGPLSPLTQQERQVSTREGGRSSTIDGQRSEGFKDRRASPAAWGEGRAQGSQDGSRPPRRDFQDRPLVERAPTAAEQDNQWRAKMKPDTPVAPVETSPVPLRDNAEAPVSPVTATAAHVGRPKLNLTKRTVSEAIDVTSPISVVGDSKASPFGGARPIDTAAKEREIEEKRLAALREKKESDDKSREEKRVAKEAAKSEKAEGETDGVPQTPDTVIVKKADSLTLEGDLDSASDSKIKEAARQKSAEAGAWRRPAGGPKPPRNDVPRGPRSDVPPRGPRNDSHRAPRANGGAPPSVASAEQVATAPEEDGWSTVSKPKKNQRGGARAISS